MSSIDERIVQMQFQNSQFEKGVAQSLKSLEKLKEELQLEKAADGLKRLQEIGDSFSLAKVSDSVDSLGERFSYFGTFAGRIIENLADTIYSKLGGAIQSVTVGQISAGWEKYAEDTNAVQTIMFATGKSIEEVEEQLRKLTFFTDETSYSYADMVGNIAKFTSNNIDLTEARVAMQGIATWAASAGQNAQTASRAMYNISQAMGVGAMKVADWKSIELANMATKDFKENAIKAAIALGTLDSAGRALDKHHTQVTIENFRDTLQTGWFTKDVMMEVFGQYGDFAEKVQELVEETGMDTSDAIAQLSGTTELFSENAFKAAQEAKTFTDAIEALRDATSTKWLNIFKLIFGNYEEAKVLWTKLANDLYEVFVDPLDTLVERLRDWHDVVDEAGNPIQGSWADFMQGIFDFMDGLKGLLVTVRDAFANLIPGVTLDDLRNLAIGVRDFGRAFKEAFGLPEEAEELADTVDEIASSVSDATGLVDKEGKAISKDLRVLNTEAVKLQNALKKGSTGKEVKQMQEQLIGAGYSLDKFGADGIWGPETQAAWEAFCKDVGLGIDSVFDEASSQSLADAFDLNRTKELFSELGDSLKMGDKSEEVKKFQERLIALGFSLDKFGADGIWGPETQKAYEEFQKAYNLDPTQEYDQKAHAIMLKALEEKYGIEEQKKANEQAKKAVKIAQEHGLRLDQVRSIFGGIFAAGGIVLKVFGAIGRVIFHVWDLTLPLRSAFLEAAAAIGDLLIGFNNWLGTSGALDNWFNSVKTALEPLGGWIKSAADSFLLFFGLRKPAEDTNKEIVTFASLWQSLKDKVGQSSIFQNVATAFKSIKASLDKIRPSVKATWESFKKNFGSALITVLKVLGGTVLALLAPIGLLIALLGKFIGFIISYVPKGIEILKNFWSALTFEGDENLGKAPGILVKAKELFNNISDFLFGKKTDDGSGKVGIFTRIGAFLRDDVAGFTQGLSEEAAAKAIEFSEKVKALYETIKTNIDSAFTVISYLFSGSTADASGLSEDTIAKIDNIRLIFQKIGNAIQLLFTGKDSKVSLISEETKAKINDFRSTALSIIGTIRDTFVSIGEGLWFLFGGNLSENKTISDDTINGIQKFKDKLSEIFRLIYIVFSGHKTDESVDWSENEKAALDFRNTIIGYFESLKGIFASIGAAIKLLFGGSDKEGLVPQEWADRIVWFRDECISIFDSIRENFAKLWPRVKLLFTGDSKNTSLEEKDVTAVLEFRDRIISFFENVGRTFKKVWAVISYLFTGKAADGVLNKETASKLEDFRNGVVEVFTAVKTKLTDIWTAVKDVFKNGVNPESIKNALTLAWEKIKDFFDGLGKTTKNIVKWGLIGFALYKILSFIGSITGLFNRIKDATLAFKGNAESLSTQILKFAGAVALISASIWALGTQMTGEEMKRGLGAFAAIIGAVTAFMVLSAVFSRKKPDKEATTLSDAVWDFAKSVAILSAAIWFLANKVDWSTFWNGLGKASIILIVLGGFMLGLKAFEKKMGNSLSMSLEGKIWQLSIIIGAMALVVKMLSGLKLGQALIGVGALAGIMISLGVFMRLASKYGEVKIKGLLSLSVAIGVIAVVLKSLSNMSFPKAAQGVAGVGIILGLIALIARTFGKYGDQIKTGQVLGIFLGIAAVIGLFGFIISKIQDVNPGVMLGFSASLAIALGAFVAACMIVGNANQNSGKNNMLNGALSIVGALLAFAGTAIVLTGALGFLDRVLGGGVQDAFARGSEILKTTAGAIKGFMDTLGADVASVAAYLGGSEITGIIQGAGGSNYMISGAWSIIGALMSFAVASLVLVGGVGALDLIDSENDLVGTFQTGADILKTTAGGIKGFMDALGVTFGDLALILGASTAVSSLGLGWNMVGGSFLAGLAIDAFITALEAFVGVNGFINKLSNGGFVDLINQGGDVLYALGGALASFATGAMDQFSSSITDFATAIGTLRNTIDGLSKDQDLQTDIDKALDIAGQLYTFFSSISAYNPDPSGIEGYNTAAEALSNDIGTFGNNINALWTGVSGISLDKNIDNDVQQAMKVAETLKSQFFDVIVRKLPTGRGLDTYNRQVTTLLDKVKQFGDNLGSFHKNINGFNTPTIEADVQSAIDAAEQVRRFLQHLKEHNGDIELNDQGISAWFGEETNQETVFDAVNKLAEAIGRSKEAFAGIGGSTLEKDVTSAVNIAKAVGELLIYLNKDELGSAFNGSANFERLKWLFDPEDERSLVSMLKGFGGEIRDIANIDDISSIFNGFASLANYLSNGETIQTDFKNTGLDMVGAIIEGLRSYDPALINDFVRNLVSSIEYYNGDFTTAGYNFVMGLVNGVGGAEGLAILAVERVASRMLGAAITKFAEASPSKATAKIGEYFTLGLAKGVGDKESEAVHSTESIATSMLDTASGTLMSLSQLLAKDIDVDPVISPVLDLTNFNATAATMDSTLSGRTMDIYGRSVIGNPADLASSIAMNMSGLESARYIMDQYSRMASTSADQPSVTDAVRQGFGDVNDSVSTLNDRIASLETAISNMKVVTDTGALIGQIDTGIDQRLGEFVKYRGRGM